MRLAPKWWGPKPLHLLHNELKRKECTGVQRRGPAEESKTFVSELARSQDDLQGSGESGSVVTASDIKQKCVHDLKGIPYDGAPEVLAKIIIEAAGLLAAIQGICKAERFEREMLHAIKMSEGANQGGDASTGKSQSGQWQPVPAQKQKLNSMGPGALPTHHHLMKETSLQRRSARRRLTSTSACTSFKLR